MYVDDDTRARHMRDAARDALRFVTGRTRADLDSDRMLHSALVWNLTITGEAAAHLTPETRAALAEAAWPKIVAMRNRLVHGYYLIAADIVWDTVTRDLPPLLAALVGWLTHEVGGEETPC